MDVSDQDFTGAKVGLYDAAGTLVAETKADGWGEFVLVPSEPGSYRVKTWSSGYVDQWWASAGSFAEATPIEVIDQPTAGINLQLLPFEATITGVVRSAVTNEPFEGVQVRARNVNGAFTPYATTNADGRYTITGLRGKGTVEFDAPVGFVDEWFDNVYSEQSATILEFNQDRTVDASISPATVVSGTITGPDSTGAVRPIAGARATFYLPTGERVDTAYANSLGRYSMSNIAVGTYLVGFTGPGFQSVFEPLYYGGGSRLSLARPIVVANTDGLSGVNAVMRRSRVISGTVVDASTGAPVSPARVSLHSLDGEELDEVLAQSGAYTFRDVRPGAYLIRADVSGGRADTWLGGAEMQSATPVRVLPTSGSLTGRNIIVREGGSIQGTLSAKDVDTSGTLVRLINLKGAEVARLYSAGGAYQFSGVVPGTYRIEFVSQSGRLVGEWFGDARSRTAAASIAVAAGEATSLPNTVLATVAAGAIEGRFVNGSNTEVEAQAFGSSFSATASVSDAGNFRFSSLPPGRYELTFADGQRYLGRYGSTRSDVVTVRSAETTVLSPVTRVERIPVRVSAFSGNREVDAFVKAYDLTGAPIEVTLSRNISDYILLPPAQYKFRFAAADAEDNLGVAWSGGGGSFEEAEVIDVHDVESANVSVELPGASTFRGTVVSAQSGRALNSVRVTAFIETPDGSLERTDVEAVSDVNGRFVVGPIGAGNYRFQLQDSSYRHHMTSWFGATAPGGTRSFSVGVTPSDIDSQTTTAMLVENGTVAMQTPVITGRMASDAVVTAKVPFTWPSTGVVNSYRWYRDGQIISGATSKSYRLRPVDMGKDITVVVGGARAGYVSSSTSSLPRNSKD